MSSTEFARRMRDRERIVGYWSVLDAPVVLERLGRVGYDYVAIDGQHGLLGYSGILAGLLAIDAGAAAGGTGTVGLVRVESKDPAVIGQALDAGAHGVIVPLVNRPDDAAQADAAAPVAEPAPPYIIGGTSAHPRRILVPAAPATPSSTPGLDAQAEPDAEAADVARTS